MGVSSSLFKYFSKVEDVAEKNWEKEKICNKSFKLFTIITPLLYFICFAIITLHNLFGKHIKCIYSFGEDEDPDSKKNEMPLKAVEQICYIQNTFILPKYFNASFREGTEVSFFGVGPSSETDEEMYQKGYQWMNFYLICEMLIFYFPLYFWKQIEREKMQKYCNWEIMANIKMKSRELINEKEEEKEEEKRTKFSTVTKNFKNCIKYKINKDYALGFVICEFACLANLILSFFITQQFLENKFANYGPEAINYVFSSEEDVKKYNLINPMDVAFPKVAKCGLYKYGPSGNIVRYDILCLLPLNNIYEKFFIVCWYWFLFLFILGLFSSFKRILLIESSKFRNYEITKKFGKKRHNKRIIHEISQNLYYSDWFVLNLLCQNLNGKRFTEFCLNLKEILNNNENIIQKRQICKLR